MKGTVAATLSVQRSLFCIPSPRFDPKSLPLHDVPQLPQIGLGDDIIGFELERAQVVVLRFGKFPIQVEDGTEVHQSSRVLEEGRDPVRRGLSGAKITESWGDLQDYSTGVYNGFIHVGKPILNFLVLHLTDSYVGYLHILGSLPFIYFWDVGLRPGL